MPPLPRSSSLARSLPVLPSSTPLPDPPLPPRRSAGVVCLPSLNLLKKRLAASQRGKNGNDSDSDGGDNNNNEDDDDSDDDDDDDDDDDNDDDGNDNDEEKDELVGESDGMALDEPAPPRVSHILFPFFFLTSPISPMLARGKVVLRVLPLGGKELPRALQLKLQVLPEDGSESSRCLKFRRAPTPSAAIGGGNPKPLMMGPKLRLPMSTSRRFHIGFRKPWI